MENKLQELTQKLYEEGLLQGREQGEELLAKSREEAKRIVHEAQKEAERMIAQAKQDVEEMHTNAITELNIAGEQIVSTLKSDINEMILTQVVDQSTAKANLDPEFIKEMMLAVAKNWKGGDSEKIDFEVMLPEEMKERFDSQFAEAVRGAMIGGVEVRFSGKVKSGFRIAAKGGGYYISFENKDYDALLKEHLRPRVAQILYRDNEKQ